MFTVKQDGCGFSVKFLWFLDVLTVRMDFKKMKRKKEEEKLKLDPMVQSNEMDLSLGIRIS